MMNILYTLIGWIMKMCYSISFNNYIVALFIFALVMQIILFPLGIKQQKSSVKMATIRPKEMAIRNKYRGRNDRATQQKMNMEIQEMYKEEGYSATAGCLPLLIQFPIIFALFGVVRMPLSYTTDLNNKNVGESEYVIYDYFEEAYRVAGFQIEAYEEKMKTLDAESLDYKEYGERIKELKTIREQITDDNAITFTETELIKFMQFGVDKFMADFEYKDGKYNIPKVEGALAGLDVTPYGDLKNASYADRLIYKENALSTDSSAAVYDFNAMLEEKGIVAEGKDNNAHALPNFDFIGNTTTLDMPSFSLNWLLLIPVLVFVSSFLSSEITRKLTTQPATNPDQPNPMNGGFMRWMMPLMSTWFSFSFPAAVGIYWIFRSITAVGEKLVLVKLYPAPKFTEDEMKQAVNEVKQAKKRKKLVTIEVDEDDTSYDDLAISEERAEKIRRRREKLEKEAAESGKTKAQSETEGDNKIDRPELKDD
ncbi:MAG: membrane protein insertase YidC [Clostridia bacterium]|nr:membrane protein insertase YidC [Clostridia bacterium]